MKLNLLFHIAILSFVVMTACQKEEEMPNPFEDIGKNQDTVGFNIVNPEPSSFAGIYQNTFKPTCANVGCHDGTFEPDFRTMESAYNTLLFQEPIKNDGNYTYRVVPNDLSKSVIIARLENRLSPPMPIQIEPDSDWPEKGEQYIQDIKTWISNGAPDITGQKAMRDVDRPKLRGAAIKYNGAWVDRRDGKILVGDTMPMIELWLSFETVSTPITELTYNKIHFSQDPFYSDTTITMDLEVMPTTEVHRGMDQTEAEYAHRLVFDPRAVLTSDSSTWYFRAEVAIPGENAEELPNDDAISFVKKYMSFEIR